MRIVIIVFNIASLLKHQIDLWRRFVKVEIKVIDNSTNYVTSKEVRKICKENDVEYCKTQCSEGDSSRSHGFACNVAYGLFGDCDIIGLVDHDIFPYKEFDLSFMYEKDLAGIAQTRREFVYLWPGLIFINTRVGEIDFLPTIRNGTHIDTGGATCDIIEKGNVRFFEEKHVEYNEQHEYYADIEGVFMHFINGSNWKEEGNHGERIGHLMTILNNKIK